MRIGSALVLFGSGLTLLIGIEQLIGKINRARANLILFIESIFIVIYLYGNVLLANDVPITYPWSIFLFITSVYLIAPLNYLYFRSLMYPKEKLSTRQAIHLLPGLVMMIIEIVLQMRPTPIKQEMLHVLLHEPGFHVIHGLLLGGGIIFIIYQSYLIRICLLFWNESGIKGGVRLIALIELFNNASVLPTAAWFMLKRGELLVISGLGTTLVMIVVFLANNRFPQLFRLFRRAMAKRRYERSFLDGVSIELLHNRLHDLMAEDSAYKNSEISLQSTAERLSVTPHQLSQFLNERLDLSFTSYINGFRVEEAKRLLIENPRQSVLSICYQVGFSSKSSFNSVFKNFTGSTPTEYRTSSGDAGHTVG